MDARTHWEAVHRESAADEVSWWEAEPATSLRFLALAGAGPDARVADVGCGQSGLAGALAARGYRHVVALDVAEAALERARARLGAAADAVAWVRADVLDWRPDAPLDVWHDRAVLHFLVDEADRRRYAERATEAVRPGGHAILATFAPDGPERCSGLPVARHDAASLARLLGDAWEPRHAERATHATPWGAEQRFQWALFRRR